MRLFITIVSLAAVEAFLLSGTLSTVAKTINAASCNFTDVSNAVVKANAGDAVLLPAGTGTWSQQLVLKGVSLIGAGSNLTIIVDEVPRGASGISIIVITNTSSQLTELSQLQIKGGVTNTQINYNGEVSAFGDSPACYRIDHILFNGCYGKTIVTYGNPYAVVDHCSFFMREEGVITFSDGYGDTNWATPPDYGGTDMLYIENCIFTNIVGYPSGVIDGDAGARVVFRHNIILNDYCVNHGTESGQRYRSTRSFEIYNNSFTYHNNNSYFTWAFMIRGGSGVIFSNTATGYYNLAGMFYYRVGESFVPWGGMTGNNRWDTNSPTLYLAGTHTGTNGPNLVVSGANWQGNQWVGYTANDTNSGQFGIIISNTANTIMVMPSKDFGPMTFTNGHHFAIYHCLVGIDQPGRGSGDLIQGVGQPYGLIANVTIGGTNWPRQVADMIYSWGNTLNGTNAGAETDYPNIQPGRDFTNNTVKPGYVPFTYPHPLTLVTYTNIIGSGGTTNTGTGGTTNTGTGGTTNTGTGGTTNTGTGGTTNTGTGGTTNTGTGGTTNTGTGGTTNTGATNKLAPPTGLHVIP